MKTWLILVSIFGSVLVAAAQSTNNLATENGALVQTPPDFLVRPLKPNELVKGKLVLSGIGVEAAKTSDPLQLLNPTAPPRYGSPEDNVLRDPSSKKVTGLKFFSLSF